MDATVSVLVSLDRHPALSCWLVTLKAIVAHRKAGWSAIDEFWLGSWSFGIGLVILGGSLIYDVFKDDFASFLSPIY